MICPLLVFLGLLTLIYDRMVLSGFAQTIGILFLVGFCIYGAQVLLVGTAPMDLARHGTPAAAPKCFAEVQGKRILEVLRKLGDQLQVGLGCVDVTPGQIDLVETISARVEKGLEFLPPERVTLNPDCGFAPGSGAAVPLDEAYTKLRNWVEGARLVWSKLR